MTSKLRILGLCAATALGLGGAANAATITPIASTPVAGTLMEGTLSGAAEITNYSAGDRASPWAGTANASADYYSIWAGGSITFVFDKLQTALNFVWGSPDSYNYMSFYNGASLVESITGSIVPQNTADGLNSAEYVSIIPVSGFDRVVVSSSGTAFEFALAPSEVPVPAAGLLLVGALAGLGAVSRRRRAA